MCVPPGECAARIRPTNPPEARAECLGRGEGESRVAAKGDQVKTRVRGRRKRLGGREGKRRRPIETMKKGGAQEGLEEKENVE